MNLIFSLGVALRRSSSSSSRVAIVRAVMRAPLSADDELIFLAAGMRSPSRVGMFSNAKKRSPTTLLPRAATTARAPPSAANPPVLPASLLVLPPRQRRTTRRRRLSPQRRWRGHRRPPRSRPFLLLPASLLLLPPRQRRPTRRDQLSPQRLPLLRQHWAGLQLAPPPGRGRLPRPPRRRAHQLLHLRQRRGFRTGDG
ncbi:hypothetical protein PVAP13_6NG254400 [Panicum virgatum]|uniref:Uncharacterized protein n=1 Tax=Panicum virgatum TaxID=38727 RepID=A0A8T0R5A0_PANVG|nr:hypothetical protein PVAP13_6NG254400 [Panicum virgatum]